VPLPKGDVQEKGGRAGEEEEECVYAPLLPKGCMGERRAQVFTGARPCSHTQGRRGRRFIARPRHERGAGSRPCPCGRRRCWWHWRRCAPFAAQPQGRRCRGRPGRAHQPEEPPPPPAKTPTLGAAGQTRATRTLPQSSSSRMQRRLPSEPCAAPTPPPCPSPQPPLLFEAPPPHVAQLTGGRGEARAQVEARLPSVGGDSLRRELEHMRIDAATRLEAANAARSGCRARDHGGRCPEVHRGRARRCPPAASRSAGQARDGGSPRPRRCGCRRHAPGARALRCLWVRRPDQGPRGLVQLVGSATPCRGLRTRARSCDRCTTQGWRRRPSCSRRAAARGSSPPAVRVTTSGSPRLAAGGSGQREISKKQQQQEASRAASFVVDALAYGYV